MQPYLSIKEINEYIMPFIVIPLFFNYNSKFFHNKRQLDNFLQILEFREELTREYLVLLIYNILLKIENKNKINYCY